MDLQPTDEIPRSSARTWLATLLIAVLALAAVQVLPGDARAILGGDGGIGAGDDKGTVAANTHDGHDVYAVRLKIVQTSNETVNTANAALATASCQDCTTVAVAIEGVLIYSDNVYTFTPVNVAQALNTDCVNCQTLAAAYQTLIQYETRMRITAAGRRTIADLRHQLHTLRLRGLDVYALAAEVDRIAGEFSRVLREEVTPVGAGSSGSPQAVAGTETGTDGSSLPSTTPGDPPGTAPTAAADPDATGEAASPETTREVTVEPADGAPSTTETTPAPDPTPTSETAPAAESTPPTETSPAPDPTPTTEATPTMEPTSTPGDPSPTSEASP